MVSTMSIANTLLQKSFEEDVSVTPMKLQKLVYFIYREHLQSTGERLFDEPFLCWQYGPVLSSLYNEFRGFGAKRINRFAKDAAGNVYVISKTSKIFESVNNIWNRYNDYTGIELSRVTHRPNTAWSKACDNLESTLRDEDIKNENEF